MPWLAMFAAVRSNSPVPAQLSGLPIGIRFCRCSALHVPPGALPRAIDVWPRTPQDAPWHAVYGFLQVWCFSSMDRAIRMPVDESRLYRNGKQPAGNPSSTMLVRWCALRAKMTAECHASREDELSARKICARNLLPRRVERRPSTPTSRFELGASQDGKTLAVR